MQQLNAELRIDSAAVSDRGLSEKRPQNEDSFIEMAPLGIYAVADGVGGAQAGDVASQMAVEILGEAFANRRNGVDAEDVMREAVQRANSAIHQMATELPQLASMATTLVALHLNGNIATIGHVGDSRLYRVDRSGYLYRETEDHSMVAEEVRAGRMTEQQAENHPGKNIISRALGAEPTVDVDLKTILVEPGTSFLLCSDGITRHVTDDEIKGVLTFGGEPAEICDYLKNTCYERGAEDNLTAVVVKVCVEGADIHATRPFTTADEEEVTLATPRSPFDEVLEESDTQDVLELDTADLIEPAPPADADAPDASEENILSIEDPFAEPARDVPPLPPVVNTQPVIVEAAPVEAHRAEYDSLPSFASDETERSGSSISKIISSVVLLLIGGLIGLGAYHLFLRQQQQPAPVLPVSTMTTNNIPLSAFEENRRNVDNDPNGWVNKNSGSPQDSEDYYLLGRAYLLIGDHAKARNAFIESRSRLASADPANHKVLTDDIAIGMAVTGDTTVQTTLKKEITDAANVSNSANSNSVR
jgi:serine/threonine protein phosphatase PrpC